MRIAILGANSQIARDLVQSFSVHSAHSLLLYARQPSLVQGWLFQQGLIDRYSVHDFAGFGSDIAYDAILNFVGVGSPVRATQMGASIFDVTAHYDGMALDYIRQHPQCRYLFLSSGAAYGGDFDEPVSSSTQATIPINNLQPQDWYGVAKLYTECRHRALASLPIVDIRVFNYFSHTQDMDARFFITDVLRAIRDRTLLKTSSDHMVRDYLHPSDFYKLAYQILMAQPMNTALDCFSKAPIDKSALLDGLQDAFGLQYELVENASHINGTGNKTNYYSINRDAAIYGYVPAYSSLEGILIEAQKYIALYCKKIS